MAAFQPYCAVCDVSYVFVPGDGLDQATLGPDTRFVCVPGRLDGREPPNSAPQGQIVGWDPQRRITTRIELTPEIWTADLELVAAGEGATNVTVTITREPTGGSRLLHLLQRRSMQRLVQRTVESELAKLPDHVTMVEGQS